MVWLGKPIDIKECIENAEKFELGKSKSCIFLFNSLIPFIYNEQILLFRYGLSYRGEIEFTI